MQVALQKAPAMAPFVEYFKVTIVRGSYRQDLTVLLAIPLKLHFCNSFFIEGLVQVALWKVMVICLLVECFEAVLYERSWSLSFKVKCFKVTFFFWYCSQCRLKRTINSIKDAISRSRRLNSIACFYGKKLFSGLVRTSFCWECWTSLSTLALYFTPLDI